MNQPDNTILNELRVLSPVLASIPRPNVFKAPEGYFDTLPALLLLQTAAGNQAVQQPAVPDGYFENLASDIMARIKEGASGETDTVLAGISNRNVFTVPEGYFEGFAAGILHRIKNDSTGEVFAETSSISTTVAGIGNKNVFTVPAGYFETLSANFSPQLEKPAKVVQMSSYRKLVKYAAAAVVTGLIALGTVFVLNKKETGGVFTASSEAIMDTAQSIIKTNSFDKEMAALSDADIVNFLESKGQDVDAALVASLAEDEKALPEAEDYLIDESTLDKVLKNLDLNN